MGESGEKGRRGGLTPEQQAEKFSTGGLDFEESVRRVLAGGPDDEHNLGAKGMGEHSGVAERELTDEEVISVWEKTIAGVSDGSLPTFSDAAALREDIRRRFGL